MSGSRYFSRFLVALVVLLIAAGLGWVVSTRRHTREGPPAGQAPASVANENAGRIDAPGANSPAPALGAELARSLELAAAKLRSAAGSPDHARKLLQDVFHQLDSTPPAERRAALETFLATGVDAPTGLDYSVGPGGYLRSWPTLRVALLDYAGRLEPDTMRALAEVVLVEPGSADEWSVALRNLARAHADDEPSDLLTGSTRRLLANEAWAATPSIGYLEAFDVLVHVRLLGELSRLEALMAPDRPRSVRFAAFLTADRLALIEPRDTLAWLARDPALLASAPAVRAGLFARADVRDAAQRVSLESYLARDDVPESERAEFAGLFPNHHTTFAHNLLTAPVSLPRGEMIARDCAALDALRAWIADPRFASWAPAFATCAGRLDTQLSPVR